jgi:quercetin dioxygenase-like cupin family protein
MRACLIAFALLCSTAVRAQAPIPVEREPRHQVVFANDALRVLDVQIAGGEVTFEHSHSRDIATICIESSPTRTRVPGQDWVESRSRRVGDPNMTEYAGKPGSHTLENQGSGRYRLIAVESQRMSGWTAGAPLEAPATTLAREGRAFRLYDVRLTPGVTSATHVHKTPAVAVLVNGAVTASSNGESAAKRLAAPGEWVLIPAGQSHTISRAGQDDVRVTEIELR